MAVPNTAPIRRRAGTVRRTSHIDMHLDPEPGTRLLLHGAARDLVTTADAELIVDHASLTASLGSDGELTSVATVPERVETEQLRGRPVGGGFRQAVGTELPDEVGRASALALLLDDLPVAALISGYARLYSGEVVGGRVDQMTKSDVCSGWRSEGAMMTSIRSGDGVPVTLGPRAPDLTGQADDDPLGWHTIGPLAIGAMRRIRLLDVLPGSDAWDVVAMFRDTHTGPDGTETVLHEYSLTASIDADTGIFTTCRAVPRVLPWAECPVAAASADRLVGRPAKAVRDFVRSDLRGISTCTHLNDLLRSLGDVPALVAALATNN